MPQINHIRHPKGVSGLAGITRLNGYNAGKR